MSKSNLLRGITLAFCIFGFFSSASACTVLSKDSLHQTDTPESYQLLYNGRAHVQLYSSDNRADYLINIQGITGSGAPFSQQKVIRVR